MDIAINTRSPSNIMASQIRSTSWKGSWGGREGERERKGGGRRKEGLRREGREEGGRGKEEGREEGGRGKEEGRRREGRGASRRGMYSHYTSQTQNMQYMYM